MKLPYYQTKMGFFRPIIRLNVSIGNIPVRYFALVDSGADMSLFHAEIAEMLGIEIETGIKRNVIGIVANESRVYYVHPVSIEIGDRVYHTVVGFMPTLSTNGYGLLGQSDFFNLFNSISFDFNKKEIEFVHKGH